jgi:hypothetical protein
MITTAALSLPVNTRYSGLYSECHYIYQWETDSAIGTYNLGTDSRALGLIDAPGAQSTQ